MAGIKTPNYFVNLLRSIYQCKEPFVLQVINKKPKTKMGFYAIKDRRIRIYSKWECCTPLEEIAIHEYAHHVHETEKRKSQNRRKERVHGPEFWRIYSALMAKAIQKGIFSDELIENIIL